MYARLVKGQMRPGKYEPATRMLEKEVIPLLQKQQGFRDELAIFNEDIDEGFAISFWDNKADLDNYTRDVYPKVRNKMAEFFEDQPLARNFEVANSTWYHIHAD